MAGETSPWDPGSLGLPWPGGKGVWVWANSRGVRGGGAATWAVTEAPCSAVLPRREGVSLLHAPLSPEQLRPGRSQGGQALPPARALGADLPLALPRCVLVLIWGGTCRHTVSFAPGPPRGTRVWACRFVGRAGVARRLEPGLNARLVGAAGPAVLWSLSPWLCSACGWKAAGESRLQPQATEGQPWLCVLELRWRAGTAGPASPMPQTTRHFLQRPVTEGRG